MDSREGIVGAQAEFDQCVGYRLVERECDALSAACGKRRGERSAHATEAAVQGVVGDHAADG
ncbi:MAG: hypothetical protein RL218_1027, partial [Actinomycetota bacterium]